jgi:hypothetical protein
MPNAAKILAKMRQTPLDWRIAHVETVARAFGFTMRKGTTSHVTLSHPALEEILTIPARKPVKPYYIRKLVALLDQVVHQ